MFPFFFILIILFSNPVLAGTQSFTLDNGLNIIVKEDKRAPVVISMLWYHVGSADEYPGITGISHLLEHLMFKGTAENPLGVFSKKIAQVGGELNALTSNDYTIYHEEVAREHLPLVFELEADRMQSLCFDDAEFNKERAVVQEERRLRVEDNPKAILMERFLAGAHLNHPYHDPIIGWMSDIEALKISDAKSWYDRYYSPNAATLVVVGDVVPEEVHALAEQYFGKIPAKSKLETRKERLDPPTYGPKTVDINFPGQVPMLLFGYPVPTLGSDPNEAREAYALEVIAALLDADESSRLNHKLVRQRKLAVNIDILYQAYNRYATEWMVFAIPHQNHSLDELKTAILEEIEDLKIHPVLQSELNRAKKQLIAENIFQQDNLFYQGMVLISQNLCHTQDDYATQIKAITPDLIQKTAQKYLLKSQITTAYLHSVAETPVKDKP